MALGLDMKPMIVAATASADATERLAAAIDRLAAATEAANEIAATPLPTYYVTVETGTFGGES